MPRIFAVGDIHGCYKTFRKLIIEKIQIRKTDQIYCIGDYIDRGKRSKDVVDFILDLRHEGYHIHTLRGNHEQLMLDSIDTDKGFELWMANGADTTLSSFGVDAYEEMDDKYQQFFSRTKYHFQSGRYIFVHAGLNFDPPDIFKDREAMLWIRDAYIDTEKLRSRIIIHGHTPKPLDLILSQKLEHSINIDCGCVYNHMKGYGHLIGLDVHEMKFIVVKNED